jgi:hypothetical protein
MENRLRNFLGKPIDYNGFPIYSPTIEEICEIGELQYSVYLHAALFDVEAIFKHVLKVDDDTLNKIYDVNEFDLFVSFDFTRELVQEAFSFFTKQEVIFDNVFSIFKIDNKVFVSKDNFEEVVAIIKEQNGITEETNEKKRKFLNKKARELFLKRKKIKEKLMEKKTGLSLKDILSILCNADGNGINIFNVGKLTIYQIFEHFERLNLKENHMRYLKVWANGHLKEGVELPDWMISGKL